MKKISRRDFLKTAGSALAGGAAFQALQAFGLNPPPQTNKPNIILFLMDALSARHMSLYGYSRRTTPYIEEFANRCTVFHNHYSAGNFTTTGTASLLTGMLAWKHRAIKGGGLTRAKVTNFNPFSLLGAEYYRFAYSQNTWADYLLSQADKEIDHFLSPFTYSLIERSPYMRTLRNDHTLGSIAQNDFLFSMEGLSSPPGSAVFGYLNKSNILNLAAHQISERYPKGTPESMSGIPYYNEQVYKGAYNDLADLAMLGNPFFAYIHLYSPHFPYRPRADYRQLFRNDGFAPPDKKPMFMEVGLSESYLLTQRTLYDRQIAQVDEEFGRLIAKLDKLGALDNSYLIFTSDHGELFERGFIGHGDLFMYEGAINVPLMIHAPGQTERRDVYPPSSNVDILPTILSMAGKAIPPEMDGKVLPGFGGLEQEDRPIFSIYALDNSVFSPIAKAVISMRKLNYKLIAYLGYKAEPFFELYNLEADPEEQFNLAAAELEALTLLKEEFFEHLNRANREFKK